MSKPRNAPEFATVEDYREWIDRLAELVDFNRLFEEKGAAEAAIKNQMNMRGVIIPSHLFTDELRIKHKTLGALNKLVPSKYITRDIGQSIFESVKRANDRWGKTDVNTIGFNWKEINCEPQPAEPIIAPEINIPEHSTFTGTW